MRNLYVYLFIISLLVTLFLSEGFASPQIVQPEQKEFKDLMKESKKISNEMCSGSLTIQNQSSLDEALSKATKEFMATRPSPFTTLNSAILIPVTNGKVGYLPLESIEKNRRFRNHHKRHKRHEKGHKKHDKDYHHPPHPHRRYGKRNHHHEKIPRDDENSTIWYRGSFNGTNTLYPASCIKLAYLVASTHYCKEKGLNYDCVDSHIRPMIQVSDNLETGFVVDRITEQKNLFNVKLTDPDFLTFEKKRKYTYDLFQENDLLGNQVILHKTYPTNSGTEPIGAEALLRSKYGMNTMNPICTSTLMAEIVSGKSIVPEATDYLKQVLFHPRRFYSIYGWGMPPGTLMYTKLGNAYNNENEIAHVILPNKKSFILTSFTDSYESYQPQLNNLGRFAELVLQNVPELQEGLPPSITLDASKAQLNGHSWKKQISRDAFGDYFFTNEIVNGTESATWTINLPSTGLYEIGTWNPESSEYGSTTIVVSYFNPDKEIMKETYSVNQRYNGGRWIPLGDIYVSNELPVIIHIDGKSTGKKVVANAIRLIKYPEDF